MNAGLANLATLKAFLLPGTMQANTAFDAKLLVIGRGVAGLMDAHCNRKFAYAAGDTVTFSADRPHFFLPRFPVVSVSEVATRSSSAAGWSAQSGSPLNLDETSGLADFGFVLGHESLLARITYTGGYFFETLETTDIGYPTATPAGATALPGVIQFAWLTQCAEVWNKFDKLGTGLIGKPDESALTGALELAPIVKAALQPFIRLQLT